MEVDSEDKNKCTLSLGGGGAATLIGNLKVTGNIQSNTGNSSNVNGVAYSGGIVQ